MTCAATASASIADPLSDRTVLGAQPDTFVVNPSKSYPWYGNRAPGERFTTWQLYAVRRLGRDPAGVDAITVYREATTREMWWPIRSLPPVFTFDCPVTWRGTHKVRVLAPDGSAQMIHLINGCGWVRPPSTKHF